MWDFQQFFIQCLCGELYVATVHYLAHRTTLLTKQEFRGLFSRANARDCSHAREHCRLEASAREQSRVLALLNRPLNAHTLFII
jgi:hypothetical protein